MTTASSKVLQHRRQHWCPSVCLIVICVTFGWFTVLFHSVCRLVWNCIFDKFIDVIISRFTNPPATFQNDFRQTREKTTKNIFSLETILNKTKIFCFYLFLELYSKQIYVLENICSADEIYMHCDCPYDGVSWKKKFFFPFILENFIEISVFRSDKKKWRTQI